MRPCSRAGRRAATLLAAAPLLLLAAGCGLNNANGQLGPSEGADPGHVLSVGTTVLLYVIVPLAAIAIISGLVLLPYIVKGNRYRPSQGWSAAPVWFAGPPDPVRAVETAEPGELIRGGASGSW